jgi:UDP-N-acetylmuramate: L-alanyl-gamma-D-glutamyl-meso-diaminopimelate ligase
VKNIKRIHFIGICGVAMSALAIAFQKAGFVVTGSDVGFFPPVSDNLKNNKINFYPGWHVEKMCEKSNPDLVVVGNVASSTNPEWKYVQKNNIGYLSYPEAIAKYFVKKNSIVCAGTYGKTTTSALLSWIMSENDYDLSYMFGGLIINDNFNSANIGKGDWSILEGDEYKSGRDDNQPKFSHYSPTHLLLTSVKWDHADIYPTEKSYFETFQKLAGSIPKNGLAVVSENVPDAIVSLFHCPIVKYGADLKIDYNYLNVKQTKNGIKFDITVKRSNTTNEAIQQTKRYNIQTSMLGDFMAENICACFAMASSIGIESEKIINAINKFQGIKRRLQKRGAINGADIYDDIAHSPAKANNTLHTLRAVYPNGKIYVIFEPNTGNRQSQSVGGYKNAFKDADEVLIPRLTKIKINSNASNQPMDGAQLTRTIKQTHDCVQYFEDDQKLLNYLKQKTQPNDAVVFMGSHGFRGMIEELTKS